MKTSFYMSVLMCVHIDRYRIGSSVGVYVKGRKEGVEVPNRKEGNSAFKKRHVSKWIETVHMLL